MNNAIQVYAKSAKTIEEQLSILRNRGLAIADETFARQQLSIISFFRLADYWRPMERDKNEHTFKPDSSFENAVSLYYFDKKLRALLFALIQGVEIAFRSKIINIVSLNHDAFWYSDARYFSNQQMFVENLSRLTRELNRSQEEFIKDHFAKYTANQLPPAWKILELASFGTLSKIFENLQDNHVKKQIANEFHLPQHIFLESWIKSISVLRNRIAHHARIWNRLSGVKPKMPGSLDKAWITDFRFDNSRLYAQLCVILYLENVIHPDNTFVSEFKGLLAQYPNVDTRAMGFPDLWEREALWN